MTDFPLKLGGARRHAPQPGTDVAPAPLFIDFEASCLPRAGLSFPIEVGLADGTGWWRAWLIRPDPGWTDWTWTHEAEQLHGIERGRLERDGRSAAQVMAELNDAAGGREVIADHDLDRHWLATLAAAARIAPAFRISHIVELLDREAPSPLRVEQAVAAADRAIQVRHRAGPDAQWLAVLVASLRASTQPLFNWMPGSAAAVRSASERQSRPAGCRAPERAYQPPDAA